jgi:hypothetical protein
MKLEFSWLFFFSQNTHISIFTKIRPVGAELFYVDRRTWQSIVFFKVLQKCQKKIKRQRHTSEDPVAGVTSNLGGGGGEEPGPITSARNGVRLLRKMKSLLPCIVFAWPQGIGAETGTWCSIQSVARKCWLINANSLRMFQCLSVVSLPIDCTS